MRWRGPPMSRPQAADLRDRRDARLHDDGAMPGGGTIPATRRLASRCSPDGRPGLHIRDGAFFGRRRGRLRYDSRMWYSLLPLLARLMIRLGRTPPESAPTLGQLHDALDDADCLIFEGRLNDGAQVLDRIRAPIDRIQGSDGAIHRAWHRLAWSELLAADRDRVRTKVEEALEELSGAEPDSRRTDLETRAWAALGFHARPGDADRYFFECADRALARAATTGRPDALLQLVFLANNLGSVHRIQGDAAASVAHYESAIRIAERLRRPGEGLPQSSWSARARVLFWSHARSIASSAAMELGEVAWQLGDRERGRGWFDRAVTLLDGAQLPEARLPRARALFCRASHRESDAILDPRAQVAPFEDVIREALATQFDSGRVLAAEAEFAIATVYENSGATDPAADRYRRVHDHLAGIPVSKGLPHRPRAAQCLGMLLRSTNDGDGAIAMFAQALELGRESPNADARHIAVVAAHHLHGSLIHDDRTAEAATALAAMDALIPTLDPGPRVTTSLLAARSRAYQYRNEDRLEDARIVLDNAVAHAKQFGLSHSGTAIAIDTDLGDLLVSLSLPGEAAACFERALEAPAASAPSGDGMTMRAELELKLARALMELDQKPRARNALKRAQELGRDSGTAAGREAAAAAAMYLGDLEDVVPGLRREHYEVAARLARLSGRASGAELVEAIEQRLGGTQE